MAEKPSAATEALTKIEDQLTCPVCLDPYTKPKLLQCFHVYCQHCLQRMVVTDQQGQHSVTCPKCRRLTPLPPNGVADLQSAFHVHHLFDIQETLKKVKEPQKLVCEKCSKTTRLATSFCRQCTKFICEVCTSMHKEWEELETHEIVSIEQVEGDVIRLISPKKESLSCPKHHKKLKLYCNKCGELICQHCTVQIHKDHEYCVISDTFETHKEEILASLEPVKKQLGEITEAVSKLNSRQEEIGRQRETVKGNIHSSFQQLRKAIDESEAQLARETDQLIDQKLKNLSTQKDEIKIMQTQRSSCLHYISESVRTGSQGEVMKSKKQLVKQVKNLTESFNPDTLEVCEQANVNYRSSPLFAKLASEELGSVYVQNVSPDCCCIQGDGITVARVGEKTLATLQVCNDQNEPYSVSHSQLECRLFASSTNKTTECAVTEQDRGCYEVAFQPTIPGPHQLQIRVNGKSIRGSPFTVSVIDTLDTPIRIIDGLKTPWGVAVNKKREVIVSEFDGKSISIFNFTGKKLKAINRTGSVDGPLGELYGVAVDSDDNILVLDSGKKILQKFSPDGESLKVVGSHGSGPPQFKFPMGIAVNGANGKVYIVDFSASCVHLLNSGLSFSSTFGSLGKEKGMFDHPSDVALDSAGSVYVADRNNHRIQVFTSDGRYLRQFGKKGSGPGELTLPLSICIDSNDLVFVGGGGNNRVSVFTSEGKFLKSFGSSGSGPGQFDRPFGIAVDQYGVVYVCDYGNNRIQIF